MLYRAEREHVEVWQEQKTTPKLPKPGAVRTGIQEACNNGANECQLKWGWRKAGCCFLTPAVAFAGAAVLSSFSPCLPPSGFQKEKVTIYVIML